MSLTNRIKVLEDQLEASAKPPTIEAYTQSHISTREKSMQTLKRSKPNTPTSQRLNSSSHSRRTIVGSDESTKMRVYNLNEEAARKQGPGESRRVSGEDWKKMSAEERKRSANERRAGSPTKDSAEAQHPRSGGRLLSRGSRLAGILGDSGEPTALDGELTPVHLRSMYPQDSFDALDPRLPEIRRTPLPTNDMKRYLKQAVSRRH